MSLEFIRCAAVKVNTDLFTGKNHSVCLKKLKSATQQGFVAESKNIRSIQCYSSRFVDRKKALEIAIAAGQTINKHNPKDVLLSEDLSEDKRFNCSVRGE